MRLSTDDYAGFKAVVASLGTPAHVYYSKDTHGNPNVRSTLAIKGPDGFYVAGQVNNEVTEVQFLLDFPGAIEAQNIQGAY